jgi:hypothetical protein
MNNTQAPIDGKDDCKNLNVKYQAINNAEIAKLKGKLELELAEAGDKSVSLFSSSFLMSFFPADDLKAAALGARHLFQRGVYYLRCARDEYRAMQEFRRNYQDDINLDDLIGKQ